ncbi:MAG: EF-hand domain-containing protein [Paracoccaceae bacterium]|nr:EF-hand domain-containing protein [Paracoccaceae bacterium]
MNSKLVMGAVAVVVGAVAIGLAAPVIAHQKGGGQGGHGFGAMFDFATLDANGDGKLTQEEMKAHRQAEIAAMDTDADGFISQAELSAHMAARMQEMAEQMAASHFKARDTDGDGKLSSAEAEMPSMPGRMFARMDADGDGALSEEEVAAMRDRMASRGGRDHGRKHWFGWDEDDAKTE